MQQRYSQHQVATPTDVYTKAAPSKVEYAVVIKVTESNHELSINTHTAEVEYQNTATGTKTSLGAGKDGLPTGSVGFAKKTTIEIDKMYIDSMDIQANLKISFTAKNTISQTKHNQSPNIAQLEQVLNNVLTVEVLPIFPINKQIKISCVAPTPSIEIDGFVAHITGKLEILVTFQLYTIAKKVAGELFANMSERFVTNEVLKLFLGGIKVFIMMAFIGIVIAGGVICATVIVSAANNAIDIVGALNGDNSFYTDINTHNFTQALNIIVAIINITMAPLVIMLCLGVTLSLMLMVNCWLDLLTLAMIL